MIGRSPSMIVKTLTIIVLVWLVVSNQLDATNLAEVAIYKHLFHL